MTAVSGKILAQLFGDPFDFSLERWRRISRLALIGGQILEEKLAVKLVILQKHFFQVFDAQRVEGTADATVKHGLRNDLMEGLEKLQDDVIAYKCHAAPSQKKCQDVQQVPAVRGG